MGISRDALSAALQPLRRDRRHEPFPAAVHGAFALFDDAQHRPQPDRGGELHGLVVPPDLPAHLPAAVAARRLCRVPPGLHPRDGLLHHPGAARQPAGDHHLGLYPAADPGAQLGRGHGDGSRPRRHRRRRSSSSTTGCSASIGCSADVGDTDERRAPPRTPARTSFSGPTRSRVFAFLVVPLLVVVPVSFSSGHVSAVPAARLLAALVPGLFRRPAMDRRDGPQRQDRALPSSCSRSASASSPRSSSCACPSPASASSA